MTYVQTDDPNDPCSLDVQWMTEDGDDWPENWEDAVPFIAPGIKAERVYRFIHEACEAAAIQYTSEGMA